jgi:hypothetical protein
MIATLLGMSALAATVLALAGCGTTSLTTDYDQRTAFDRYRTYAIAPGPVLTDDAVTAVPDQLVQNRINTMLGKELTARGLARAAPQSADLIVTYAASARDVQQLVDNDLGPTPTPSLINGDVWVQTYREAMLDIDVLDAATQERVWHVTARTKNEDFHDPQFVASIVSRALEDFPPSEL